MSKLMESFMRLSCDTEKRSYFPILSLPAEVRMMIYRYCVLPEGPRLYKTKAPRERWCLCPNLAILRVNRQIYAEASDVLYTEAKPVLELYEYLPYEADGTLGIMASMVPPLSLPNFERGACASGLDVTHLARFNYLAISVQLDPQFPTLIDYPVLSDFFSNLREAIRCERQKNSRHIELYLNFKLYDPHAYDRESARQQAASYQRILTAIEMLSLQFHALEKSLDNFEYAGTKDDSVFHLGTGNYRTKGGRVELVKAAGPTDERWSNVRVLGYVSTEYIEVLQE